MKKLVNAFNHILEEFKEVEDSAFDNGETK